MCVATVCKTGCDVMNFEVKLIFLIKSFNLDDEKVMTKTKILENDKSFYDEIKNKFLEGKSPSLTNFLKVSQVTLLDYAKTLSQTQPTLLSFW